MTPPGLGLLLPGMSVVEFRGAPEDRPLLGAEAATVATAVPGRRREFATARDCARQALARLDPAWRHLALPPAADRSPRWPEGVVGSITHTHDYCAAAVTWASACQGVGVDAEPNLALPQGVLARTATLAERRALPDLPGVAVDRLLWSAKEAAFKAWFPRTGVWVEFGDVTARLWRTDAGVGRFSVAGIEGGWLLHDGLLLAAAVIPDHAAARDLP